MPEFSVVDRVAQPTALVRSTIAVADIPQFLGRAYEAVMRVLAVPFWTGVPSLIGALFGAGLRTLVDRRGHSAAHHAA
jgi:hypothetical protein